MIGKLGAIAAIAAAVFGSTDRARAQPATQPVAGCWETYGYPRDSRSFCVSADGSVRLVTHAYEGGGKCASYPIARMRMNGDALSFVVPRGQRNCERDDGAILDSAGGKFDCEILNPERIACHVTWEGWQPTTELYRRKQEHRS